MVIKMQSSCGSFYNEVSFVKNRTGVLDRQSDRCPGPTAFKLGQ